jgi:hypothetical protein
MERTITFIAEHKKREYEQLNEELDSKSSLPQDQQELNIDPEQNLTE